jgi:ketosteroid isomerase-like protein
LWLSVIAGGAAVVVAVTVAGLYVVHRNSDPVKIRSLVGDFSAAVYGGDPRQMARYMCAEGAQSFLDTIEDPATPAAHEAPPPFDVSDIQVKGDVASAKLTFKPTGVQTMYFRKEAGKWTVCAAAEDQM